MVVTFLPGIRVPVKPCFYRLPGPEARAHSLPPQKVSLRAPVFYPVG
jgi:hypothetical protein